MCSIITAKSPTIRNRNTENGGWSDMSEMMLDSKIVGEVLAEFRRRKGVSQEVLSGLSDIGRTHLSAIERGERKPTLETLYRISLALGVSMSEIIGEIEKRL